MRVAKGRLNWGVFFVVLGAVPIALRQGIVAQSDIDDLWRLWPLIFVGIGIGFILSRTRAYFIGGLIVAVTLGLIFGSFFSIGPNVGCDHGSGSVTSVSQSGSFSGPASVQLTLRCGTADITTSSDSSWHVDATNDGGHNPDISSTATSVTVESDKQVGDWLNRGDDTWKIALPEEPQLDLTTSMDLGEATYRLSGATLSSATFNMSLGTLHVDLTEARLQHLTVSASLGATYVELDGSSDLTGDIKTSLGSFRLCAPPELGLQIKSNDSLSATSFGNLGMYRTGDVWQTPNYQTAAHKATLTVDTSLGSFELQSSGGCK